VAAGFKSEWWPDLSRNGGRLQIGTPAGFMSEYPAGLNRNPHLIGNGSFAEWPLQRSAAIENANEKRPHLTAVFGMGACWHFGH
jgi:hypothetical protein